MNIILGDDQAELLNPKYVVLTLDTFLLPNHDKPVTSYCVVDSIPLHEFSQIESWRQLHENLIINFAKKNWAFCLQAIDHLTGKWNKDLDSFYENLRLRVEHCQASQLDKDWTHIIDRRSKDIV